MACIARLNFRLLPVTLSENKNDNSEYLTCNDRAPHVWTQRRSAKVLPLPLPHDTALSLRPVTARVDQRRERERPSPSRLPPTSSHTGFIARARTAQRSTLASRSLVFTPPRSVSCSLGATLAMNPRVRCRKARVPVLSPSPMHSSHRPRGRSQLAEVYSIHIHSWSMCTRVQP